MCDLNVTKPDEPKKVINKGAYCSIEKLEPVSNLAIIVPNYLKRNKTITTNFYSPTVQTVHNGSFV
jgi:hypothetical protein